MKWVTAFLGQTVYIGIHILYVQEVLLHLDSKLLHDMGQDFLDMTVHPVYLGAYSTHNTNKLQNEKYPYKQ